MSKVSPKSPRKVMELFAIRHIPSGLFLPHRHQKKGYTHDDPKEGMPRLFTRRSSATAALRCWLQGEWSDKGTVDSYTGEWDYSGPEPTKKRPDRKANEMEVVTMVLRPK